MTTVASRPIDDQARKAQVGDCHPCPRWTPINSATPKHALYTREMRAGERTQFAPTGVSGTINANDLGAIHKANGLERRVEALERRVSKGSSG
jgi:hypothetical protein